MNIYRKPKHTFQVGDRTYHNPKYYNEELHTQALRLETELEKARTAHALRIANQSLKYLETRRRCGEIFTSLEAEIMMHTQCKMDGVAPEFIPAVVSLIVERYVPRVA